MVTVSGAASCVFPAPESCCSYSLVPPTVSFLSHYCLTFLLVSSHILLTILSSSPHLTLDTISSSSLTPLVLLSLSSHILVLPSSHYRLAFILVFSHILLSIRHSLSTYHLTTLASTHLQHRLLFLSPLTIVSSPLYCLLLILVFFHVGENEKKRIIIQKHYRVPVLVSFHVGLSIFSL